MRKCTSYILIIFLLVSFGCSDRSKSPSISVAKKTPEEQGVSELLKPRIDFVVREYGKIVEYREKYWKYTNSGKTSLAESYSKKCFSRFQKLVKYISNRTTQNDRTLVVPSVMGDLANSVIEFENLKYKISPTNLADQHWTLIEEHALKVVNADKELAALWSKRRADHSATNISQNLTFEYGGIPFRIDFANNEIKVKYTGKIGPFKIGAAAGPSSRSGIKTLILQNSKHRRCFAVGGKPLELHIPESTLTTNGSTMTITAIE